MPQSSLASRFRPILRAVTILAMLSVVVTYIWRTSRAHNLEIQAANNLRGIVQSCNVYGASEQDQYPPHLAMIFARGIASAGLRDPRSGSPPYPLNPPPPIGNPLSPPSKPTATTTSPVSQPRHSNPPPAATRSSVTTKASPATAASLPSLTPTSKSLTRIPRASPNCRHRKQKPRRRRPPPSSLRPPRSPSPLPSTSSKATTSTIR